jgi:hypothetical protein
MFLVRNLPYGTLKPCMRRVVHDVSGDGHRVTRDLAGWLIIYGIDDDIGEGENAPTTGAPSWAIAPDDLNSIELWRWMPMPEAEDFPS